VLCHPDQINGDTMADLNTTEMMTLCTTVAKGSGSKSSEEYQDTD